jgi:tetratricopeptide (TPR) repeat protein
MCRVRFAAAGAFLALALAAPARAQSASPPTFAEDVAPILHRSCSTCHRPGESGPYPLLTYDDAKKYAPQIAAAVSSRAMPPWLPAHGFGDFALGLALGSLGRSREAIQQFRAALALQPNYANARFNLARPVAKTGHFDEAASDFVTLITAEPDDPQLRTAYGQLLLQMNKPADAMTQFDKSLALDPNQQGAREDRDIAERKLSAP